MPFSSRPTFVRLAVFIPLLVLNYNGRPLLEECLPSLLRAAAGSSLPCQTWVVDNGSTDDSLEFLARNYPHVPVIGQPNRGLCSYNEVLRQFDCPVAVLLNNDVKLAPDSLDPLLAPLLNPASVTGLAENRPCWLTAPLCWRFDGHTYEGQKTAVHWRHGLVQATSFFRGHESGIRLPGGTCSAGAVLAVDRKTFLRLGGFDPLYLPGRLEDLDLSYRAYLAGYQALHVPQSVAFHLGQATFAKELGGAACDELALRNTLLFQWKNLRRPEHLARQACGLALRLLRDVAQAPLTPHGQRWTFWRALRAAWRRRHLLHAADWRRMVNPAAEREYFHRFHPARINAAIPAGCG